MNIGVKYMERLLDQFIMAGPDVYYQSILEKAREKMKGCYGVDLELLHLSNIVLERARIIEKKENRIAKEWRDLSYILRRAAHKIHRECVVRSEHSGFLKAV